MIRENPHRSIALLLVLCLTVTVWGQTGLERMAVHNVFSGQLTGTRILSETHVTGDALAKYHLNVFRSVQCSTNAKGIEQTERLLAQDEQKATEKEVQRTNRRTRSSIFRYAQTDGTNHYIIYQRRSQTDFVCVYLEGTASIQQLKKIFDK